MEHLLPLLNPWLIAEMSQLRSLLSRYYFGKCSSELAELISLPCYGGTSTCYSDIVMHEFSVAIPRCYKDVYVNSPFSCTARFCNSLHGEYFPLTYDL